MTNSDSIGVIIPVYNCARYIRQALVSLERQTLAPDLVIVTDDGSTDDTARVVKQYKARSNLHINLIRQANKGIAAARNTAANHCDCEYIALLDGDDAFYPSFLEKAKAALRDNPELIYCFSDRDVIDDKGLFLRHDLEEPRFRTLTTRPLGGNIFFLEDNPFATLIAGNVIPINNSILRKTTFDQLGGFDPDLRAVEDQPFLLELSRLGRFGFIDEPLGIWRRHSTCISGANAQNIFRMNWYQDIAYAKLLHTDSRVTLDEAERLAVQQAKELMPLRLVYTAADAGHIAFFGLATQYALSRAITWPTLWKCVLRYCWRIVKRPA